MVPNAAPDRRRLARLGAGLLAAFAALLLADLAASSGSVGLRRYESWLAQGPRVSLVGLWPGAEITSRVRLAIHQRSRGMAVRAGGAPALLDPGVPGAQVVEVVGIADPEGRLMLRPTPRGSSSIERITFVQRGGRRMPPGRLLGYALLVGLAFAWGLQAAGSGWGLAAALLVGLSGSVALAAGYRVQTLVFLPWAVLLLGLALCLAAAARLARLPRRATLFVSFLFLARTAMALQPGFPSIDAAAHSENVQRFEAGEVIRSAAPAPEYRDAAFPYPPAFYALVAPLVPGPWPTPQFPIVLVLALLEGTAPLLLLLLARAASASETAAVYAACVLAALPESVLVLAKGIAPNSLGQWVTLLLLLALFRGHHPVVVAGLFALVFLSHFGAGLVLLSFLGCWTVYVLGAGQPWRPAARAWVCAAAGAAVAWLAYYREVQAVTMGVFGHVGSHAIEQAGSFFGVRWYRAGKTLQDLALKLGAAPPLAAALAVRRGLTPGVSALVWPWLGAGIGLGLVAIFTPVPLRFEYFVGPAVALGAAVAADGMGRRGRALVLAVPLLIQALLALSLWARRFNLISVIMESPRWPFPFRW